MAVHRNRVIYQSEALFLSPDATGYHYTGAEGHGLMTPPLDAGDVGHGVNARGQMLGWEPGETWPAWNGDGSDPAAAKGHGTIIKQLKRIQSANYGFTVNRTDVNQFGHLSRLDSVVVESPTVNLDFSYYLLDGYNERHLEFITDGMINTLSGAIDPNNNQAGSNFFIVTTPENRDVVKGDVNLHSENKEEEKTVISLGNGYITDYSVDVSVGALPTASVTVEGMNIKSDIGTTGIDVPAVDMINGSLVSDAWDAAQGKGVAKVDGCTGLFSLPAATSGYAGCGDVAALRPGDVVLDIENAALITKQVEGEVMKPLPGSAHIQSASLSLPLARTTLQRLGSTFGFSKSLDLPITATLSISAILSELKESNMVDLLCDCSDINLSVTIHNPDCVDCRTKDSPIAMKFTLRGCQLDSENISSTIGDNKTVDLSFSCQVGGADDSSKGLFLYGIESQANQGLPPGWVGKDGSDNEPYLSPVPPTILPYAKTTQYGQSVTVSHVNGKYYKSNLSMKYKVL
tara:strand:+ start:6562 stop:8109 length:1548 start_codon:yes stop_codon:yes gene_type:complete